MSDTLDQINTICGTERRRTSAFHPQTNGLCERSHRTIADALSKYVNRNKSDWDELLPFMVKAYNTVPQKSTKFSPFFLVHGFEAESTFDAYVPPPPAKTLDGAEYGEELTRRLTEARELALMLAEKEKNVNKDYYDDKRVPNPFKPGDRVWLDQPLRVLQQSDKLQNKFFGPYRILEQTGPETFKIGAEQDATTPGNRNKPKIVHSSRLKLVIAEAPPNPGEGQQQPTQTKPASETNPAPQQSLRPEPSNPPANRYPTRKRRPPRRFEDFQTPNRDGSP